MLPIASQVNDGSNWIEKKLKKYLVKTFRMHKNDFTMSIILKVPDF